MTVQQLRPGFIYHYEYQGLRLLVTRAGTYYRVPVGWSPQLDITYVFNQSDQLRIKLLSGVIPSDNLPVPQVADKSLYRTVPGVDRSAIMLFR